MSKKCKSSVKEMISMMNIFSLSPLILSYNLLDISLRIHFYHENAQLSIGFIEVHSEVMIRYRQDNKIRKCPIQTGKNQNRKKAFRITCL